MAEIDRARLERLKARFPQAAGRKRTVDLQTAVKQYREQSRSLTATRSRDLDRTTDGEAFREAYKGALRRKN